MAGALIGPIEAYDREHGSSLLETLRVFVECDASWTEAARRLHTHVNTLRYRIDRVHALSGRNPRTLQGLIDLSLALEASAQVGSLELRA